MSDNITISKSQWDEYRNIQMSGEFNMYDPDAREMTTLSTNEWIHIMKNYSKLKEQFEGGE